MTSLVGELVELGEEYFGTTGAWIVAIVVALAVAYVINTSLRVFFYPGSLKTWRKDPSSQLRLPREWLGLPFLGVALGALSRRRVQFWVNLALSRRIRLPPSFRTYTLGIGGLFVVSDSDAIAAVDRSDPLPVWADNFKRFVGPSCILTAHGDLHRSLRDACMGALSPSAVAAAAPDVARTVKRHVGDWAAVSARGEALSATQCMRRMAMDVFLTDILGMALEEGQVARVDALMRDLAMGVFAGTWWLMPGYGRYLAGLRASEKLRRIFEPHVRRAMEEAAKAGASRGKRAAREAENATLLQRLAKVEDDGPLSMDAMLDNLLGIVFAGHDTTAITAANILALLAVHPDWAMRLVEEQRRVVQLHGESLTSASLLDMPETEAVIKETLRVMPTILGPVKEVQRTVEVRPRVGVPFQVPVGCRVHPSYIHHGMFDSAVFGSVPRGEGWGLFQPKWGPFAHMDPVRGFDPRRWLDSPWAPRPSGFVAFGTGSRLCVGKYLALVELKAVLAVLLRSYRVEVLNKSLDQKRYAPMFELESGVPFRLHKMS